MWEKEYRSKTMPFGSQYCGGTDGRTVPMLSFDISPDGNVTMRYNRHGEALGSYHPTFDDIGDMLTEMQRIREAVITAPLRK